MTEEEQLAQISRNFGAEPPRDKFMARKLLERADQLSLSRGMDRLEALQYLLSLMVKARNGDDPSHSA